MRRFYWEGGKEGGGVGKCLQTADLYGVVARGGGGVVSGGWRGKNANVMVGTFSSMYVQCQLYVLVKIVGSLKEKKAKRYGIQ